jgi:hypothetical protein
MHTVQRHDLQEPHGHQCLLQFVPRAPSGRSEYTPPCHPRDAGDESPTSAAIEKSGDTATTKVIDMQLTTTSSAPGRRFVATALRMPAVKLSRRVRRDGGNSENSFVDVRRHNIGKTASSQRSVEKYHRAWGTASWDRVVGQALHRRQESCPRFGHPDIFVHHGWARE